MTHSLFAVFLRSHAGYLEFEPELIALTEKQITPSKIKGVGEVAPFVCPDAPSHLGRISSASRDSSKLGNPSALFPSFP
jgi:hypothetical protein